MNIEKLGTPKWETYDLPHTGALLEMDGIIAKPELSPKFFEYVYKAGYRYTLKETDILKCLHCLRGGLLLAREIKFDGKCMGNDAIPKGSDLVGTISGNNKAIGYQLENDQLIFTPHIIGDLSMHIKNNTNLALPEFGNRLFRPETVVTLLAVQESSHRYCVQVAGMTVDKALPINSRNQPIEIVGAEAMKAALEYL
jgi:hypothetical protein